MDVAISALFDFSGCQGNQPDRDRPPARPPNRGLSGFSARRRRSSADAEGMEFKCVSKMKKRRNH